MFECAWCTAPVESEGDTCNEMCYKSYWIALALTSGVTLGDGDVPPRDLYQQPWYVNQVGADDHRSSTR